MRVVSGEYGGRPLKAVKGKNTRPTTDKVKESLFHMIGPYFSGGTALDLYSGSGSLGIEAVSRGMDQAYLVDKHPLAIKTIHENVAMTKEADKFIVWKKTDQQALDWLQTHTIMFDLVLLDPPYEKQDLGTIIHQLISSKLVNPKALIVCETDKDTVLDISHTHLTLLKEKVYGLSKITVYEWRPEDD